MKRFDVKITHWGTVQNGRDTVAVPVTDTIRGVPGTQVRVSPQGVDIKLVDGYSQHYYQPIKVVIKETT